MRVQLGASWKNANIFLLFNSHYKIIFLKFRTGRGRHRSQQVGMSGSIIVCKQEARMDAQIIVKYQSKSSYSSSSVLPSILIPHLYIHGEIISYVPIYGVHMSSSKEIFLWVLPAVNVKMGYEMKL